jgi:hypothetical protein
MQPWQFVAYQHPCYLAEETMDPRFSHLWTVDGSTVSLILTANIGEE